MSPKQLIYKAYNTFNYEESRSPSLKRRRRKRRVELTPAYSSKFEISFEISYSKCSLIE